MNYTQRFVGIANKIRELVGIPEQLTGIRESIEQQGEATRAAYERKQQQEQEQWRRVEVRFTDEEVRQRKIDQQSQTRIQQSIKRATWATFGAAFLYAGLTFMLWLSARDQLETEQRGWLVFDPNYSDTIVFGPNNSDVLVPFRLVNIGKTPTRTIEGFVIVEELTNSEQPTFSYRADRATPIRVGILYPGSEYDQTTKVSEFSEGHKVVTVTEAKRKKFGDGSVVFNVWGRLTYFDVFQHSHWVQFCHAVTPNPSGKTKGCADYNLVDTPNRWVSLKAIFRR
jgi:hypothetical protein